MPIYEYLCGDCGRISTYLVMNLREAFHPACKRCRGTKMTKLISRVARVRSEESRLESLADPSKLGDIDEKDPASMARWMKHVGKEMGEDPTCQVRDDLPIGQRAIDPGAHGAEIALAELRPDRRAGQFQIWQDNIERRRRKRHLTEELGADLVA